jgi:tetratricopeptide (TPR) repeat protein
MDLLRFKVKPQTLAMNFETFTIGFSSFTTTSAMLEMMWEKTGISLKVETEPDVKISEQIKKVMANPLGQAAQNYYQSASYYYENGKDLKQALEWINKATEINKTAFWMMRMKSLIQAKSGDYKGAIESAEMSKKMSAEAKNDEWVKMNETSIAEWKKLVK